MPWVAAGLAISFAAYGVLKKKAATPAVEGLAVEATVVLPFMVGYLVWLEYAGRAEFGHAGWSTSLLLAAARPAPALPRRVFAGAGRRIPLTYLGLLQYLTPTVQFLLAVFAFGEPMPAERLAGFLVIWTALTIFMVGNACRVRTTTSGRGPWRRGCGWKYPGHPGLPLLPRPVRSRGR
ncbi:MAG: chloramphenicol-sensitive protein RarD [Kribbellaceae bacterium]|nr:chloramphenicol-sensitive protein RarD [Kribbellaceae bacterium]